MNSVGEDDVATDKKREEVREKQQQQHPLKGLPSPSPSPKILTQDTVTAWEKNPPLKEGRKVHPPKFSRLLSSLSEESLVPQKDSVQAMEPPKEELEDLVPRELPKTAQDRRVSINFSAPSPHHPQQVPAVEMVEPEPMGLEIHAPRTSRDAENLIVQSTPSFAGPKKEDAPCASFHRAPKIHPKVQPPSDAGYSIPGTTDTFPSVWSMGQRISRWRLAHQRGYHVDQLTQDKNQKNMIMKHERDTKAAVPLPLQEVIEEEALEILKGTLKAYQKHLGVNHPLTIQLEDQADKLHLRLKGRGVID